LGHFAAIPCGRSTDSDSSLNTGQEKSRIIEMRNNATRNMFHRPFQCPVKVAKRLEHSPPTAALSIKDVGATLHQTSIRRSSAVATIQARGHEDILVDRRACGEVRSESGKDRRFRARGEGLHVIKSCWDHPRAFLVSEAVPRRNSGANRQE
jgi:hypothetical protein